MSKLRHNFFRALSLFRLVALARRLRSKDVVILMFHSVIDDDAPTFWKPLRPQLSVTEFERILSVLNPYYEFVTMDAVQDILQHGNNTRRPKIAVTFDDGYDNNIGVALPVLERYSVPAIIYLATSYIENSSPLWVDRLDFAVQALPDEFAELVYRDQRYMVGSRDGVIQRKDFTNLRRTLKADSREKTGAHVIEEFVAQVERKAGTSLKDCETPDPYSSFMSVATVQRLSEHPLLSFGCHTRNHPILPGLGTEEKRGEIWSAKKQIEEWSQEDCCHFAYPNGDFDAETVRLVRELGFDTAVTVDAGLNRVGDDPWRLKRFHIPLHRSRPELLAQLVGADQVLSRIKSCIRTPA